LWLLLPLLLGARLQRLSLRLGCRRLLLSVRRTCLGVQRLVQRRKRLFLLGGVGLEALGRALDFLPVVKRSVMG